MDPKTRRAGRPAKPRTNRFFYLLRQHRVKNQEFADTCHRALGVVKKWNSGEAPIPDPHGILLLVRQRWPKLADDLEPIWLAGEKQELPVPTMAEDESPAAQDSSAAPCPEPSGFDALLRYFEEDLSWPLLGEALFRVSGYPDDPRCEPGPRVAWKTSGLTAWDWNTSSKDRLAILKDTVAVAELARGIVRAERVRTALRTLTPENVDNFLRIVSDVRPLQFPAVLGEIRCHHTGERIDFTRLPFDPRRVWGINAPLEERFFSG